MNKKPYIIFLVAMIVLIVPLIVSLKYEGSGEQGPLGMPTPVLKNYEVGFPNRSNRARAHITEFADSKGHHCVMGLYGDRPVLSCEGH